MAQAPAAKPVRIETLVRYHGSQLEQHGSDWMVIDQYPGPDGRPRYDIADPSGDLLLNVRHTSITPL